MIAVVGATGYMGRHVVADLLERKCEVLAIGRDPTRLADLQKIHPNLKIAPAKKWDSAEFSELFRGSDVVISCAGPFSLVGSPIVEGAVLAGAHYCDSTGEYDFIQKIFEQDSRASSQGVALVPGVAFEFTLGDLGLAIAGEGLGAIKNAHIVYSPGTQATSPAMRQSIFRQVANPSMNVGVDSRTVSFGSRKFTGIRIPSGETLMSPRHLQIRDVKTYHVLGIPAFVVRFLGRLMRTPGIGTFVTKQVSRGPNGPTSKERATDFGCHIRVETDDGKSREVVLEGRDAWGFAVRALTTMAIALTERSEKITGSRAAAEVVNPRDFLSALRVRITETKSQ